MVEVLIPFLLSIVFSPAGFIGFCCGLARTMPAVLAGTIVATVLETFLAFAVFAEGVDPLYILLTPVASLAASAVGWGCARLFFGPRNRQPEETGEETTRLAYKHDILEPSSAEDF